MENEDQRPLGVVGIVPRSVGVFAGVVTRLGTDIGGVCAKGGKVAGGWTKGLFASRKKEGEEAPSAAAVEPVAPEPAQAEIPAAAKPEPEPEPEPVPEPEPEPLGTGTEKGDSTSI